MGLSVYTYWYEALFSRINLYPEVDSIIARRLNRLLKSCGFFFVLHNLSGLPDELHPE